HGALQASPGASTSSFVPPSQPTGDTPGRANVPASAGSASATNPSSSARTAVHPLASPTPAISSSLTLASRRMNGSSSAQYQSPYSSHSHASSIASGQSSGSSLSSCGHRSSSATNSCTLMAAWPASSKTL